MDASDDELTVLIISWEEEVIYELVLLFFINRCLFFRKDELEVVNIVWILFLNYDLQCPFEEGFDLIVFITGKLGKLEPARVLRSEAVVGDDLVLLPLVILPQWLCCLHDLHIVDLSLLRRRVLADQQPAQLRVVKSGQDASDSRL